MASSKKKVASATKEKAPKKRSAPKRVTHSEEAEEHTAAPVRTPPTTITNRLIDIAIEAGLPELDEDCDSIIYHGMWETYVRFIRQSPEKWEAEKDVLLEKLEEAKNVA